MRWPCSRPTVALLAAEGNATSGRESITWRLSRNGNRSPVGERVKRKAAKHRLVSDASLLGFMRDGLWFAPFGLIPGQ